ncbi:MAG: DUF3429 domain-containing protein [Pseudomonadota bacterium]
MTDAAAARTHDADPAAARKGLPQSAALLAYAGALPLLILAIIGWTVAPGLADGITAFTIAYAIALLAFFGGVRWGVAVMRADGPSFAQLIGAVMPVFMAAPLMFVAGPVTQLALLSVIFPALLIDDLRTTRKGVGAPTWYLGVRTPLTIVLELALLATLARLLMPTYA